MLPKKKNIVLLFLYYLMLLVVELFVVFAEVQIKLATYNNNNTLSVK